MNALKPLITIAGISTAGTAMYSFGLFSSTKNKNLNKTNTNKNINNKKLNKTNTNKNINNKKLNESKQRSLIGKILNKNNQNIANTNLIQENDKNFLCKIDETEINDCQIYKLNISTDKIQLLTDLSNIFDNDEVVISYSKTDDSKVIDGKNISVVKKNRELLFNISIENASKQKTNGFLSKTIIAKVKTINQNATETGDKNFKCKLQGKSEKINCEIIKLNYSFDKNEKKLTPNSFLQIEQQVEVKEDIDLNSFVIIKTTEADLYSDDWKKSNPIIYLNKDVENDEENKFIEVEYFSSLSNNFFYSPTSKYDYLVVSASANNVSIVQSSQPNQAVNSDQSLQNSYECIINVSNSYSITDDTCEIYKFSNDSSSSIKKIYLDKITQSPYTQKLSDPITENENYVLKIKRNKLSKLNTDSNTKIILKNKANPSQKVNLSKKTKLIHDRYKFKTNLLLVKVKTKTNNQPTTNDNNYKCKFTSDQIKKLDCKVYSFSSNSTINETTDLVKANIETLTSSTKTNAEKDNYLIIEIQGENNNFTEKELRGFIPEIYLSGDNGAMFLNSEYQYSYAGHISSPNFSNSELFRIKETSIDYLVVKHESDGNPKANDEFNTSGTKNYKCKFTDRNNIKIDDTCVLKEIPDPTNNKAIKYQDITSASSEITKDKFKTNKYFKLIINNPNILYYINTDSIINIQSNKTPEHEYGTVKVISKNFNDRRTAKTPFYLVKAKDPINNESLNLNNSTCELKYEWNSQTCTIYKFQATEESNYNDLNFTQSQTAITQISDIITEKHYVIKFSENNQQMVNINEENQKLILTAAGREKITDFDIIAPIYSSDNNHSSGTVILLK